MKQIAAIQGLRAIAANMVLFEHLRVIETKYSAGTEVIPAWLPNVGELGVYVFFVISGFIMALLSRDAEWPSFLWARITRIYPAYWFYTLVVLGVSLVASSWVNASVPIKPELWRSLLLWPDRTLPLLAVGWSLVHEMYFYLVMTAIIGLRLNLPIALLGWSLVSLLPSVGPVSAVITSPLTLLFIAGAGIGLAVPTTALARVWTPRWLVALGDASYSIYLSHVLVVSALGRLWATLPGHDRASEAVFIAICFAAANCWGLISYRVLETPAIAAARRITPPLLRARTPRPAGER